ncbi:ABC transporter ATP-binding protein [Moraxella cuniculi]|uniref:Uncharacterized ABC transporter ATP-binding protein YbbL n=1 Tax=Moraxella cuniculi TaxID=34061 RepID=A0A3S4UUW7_9GAMM|nr:ATP-binding cassette domain-containing protein [Moraxella cuniculi]VEG13544.1 Uncharacterized ABC transporter ATP-binding protein YbbL [Moraxella cuniculi]
MKSKLLDFCLQLSIPQKNPPQAAQGMLCTHDKVVLMGESGSGKSLLLSALAGQIAYQGWVKLHLPHGIEQADMPPYLWRDKVALLTQNPLMLDGTVLDNLQLPYRFAQHKDKTFDLHWQQMQLAKFHKEPDFLQRQSHSLSGGERQIVHFLRTLQLDPVVLLLDEPTAALDKSSAAVLIDCINHWTAEKDRAVLWVSHQPDESDKLAASCWYMRAGPLDTRVR